MSLAEERAAGTGTAAMKRIFANGNEMAAEAARQVDFHVMGYFPITPSTEIAENLDKMKAQGKIRTVMIPGDGEHGAAGISYGASWSGGRVLNATSAQGLLYALEQYPVQSGTRRPMLVYLVTRTVSGPLDIKGDHSDLAYAMETGWVVFFAKDPQEVYDLSFVALATAEDPRVRLPVIVAFDGFFTSHQRRPGLVVSDDEAVRTWLGPPPEAPHLLDPNHPITAGAYMNEPDLLNNRYQLHLAMEAAREVAAEKMAAFENLSGRAYGEVASYRMEDARVAMAILGSSFDTAKEAVDILRESGVRAGAFAPTILRPFPGSAIRDLLRRIPAVVVCDRQDTAGAEGGRLSTEIRAAIQADDENTTRVFTRIYGLGGRDYTVDDALYLFRDVLGHEEAAPFAFHGAYPGEEGKVAVPHAVPAAPHCIAPKVTRGEKGLATAGTNLRDLTMAPARVLPGHSACPGCGIYPNLNLLFKGIPGRVVLLFATGCAEITSSGYPSSAFPVSFLHNLFQNGAPTLSGLVEAFHERVRRGEIPDEPDITFVMVTGDGGMDIGIGASLGTAFRNHKMILMEYDNGGYMNTGYQGSTATPFGVVTTTSHAGKTTFPRDSAQIFAASHAPYVATVSESFPKDFVDKAAKAAAVAKEDGFVFLRAISACPLNWGFDPRHGVAVIDKAVRSTYFPLYEVDHGRTKITFDPEGRRRIPVSEWLSQSANTKHLVRPENAERLAAFQGEVDRRWARLQAMHASPIL